jgi:dihydroxyacetone kinase-like protein
MGFALTAKDYSEYLRLAYKKIHDNGDTITRLDAATGDGDHWVNIGMGFGKLEESVSELAAMSLSGEFKNPRGSAPNP